MASDMAVILGVIFGLAEIAPTFGWLQWAAWSPLF